MMNSSLLQYCQTMSMSYSYKPVLLLALIKHNGKITISEAAHYFFAFYSSRLERGLVSEKANSIFCRLDCTMEQIKQNIITNPVNALLNSSKLFRYDSESECLEVSDTCWSAMSKTDISEVVMACKDRLDRYYGRLIVPASEAYVLFQKPEEDNGYLSNNYPSEFVAYGQTFTSMLQYMTYRKALAFGAEDKGRQVLRLNDPTRISKICASLSKIPNLFWDGQKQIIAYHGLIAKFKQNEAICHHLLATGSAVIVACFPDDPVWGIGLPRNDAESHAMENWRGQNLLGFTLMQARNAIERISV